MVYLGLMTGSLIAGPFFNNINNKLVVCMTISGNLACVIVFPFVRNYTILSISRICVGFFQVFLIIYFPLWIDNFGGK